MRTVSRVGRALGLLSGIADVVMLAYESLATWVYVCKIAYRPKGNRWQVI